MTLTRTAIYQCVPSKTSASLVQECSDRESQITSLAHPRTPAGWAGAHPDSPYLSETSLSFVAAKGYMRADDINEPGPPSDVACGVYWNLAGPGYPPALAFAYYLYRDRNLPGVCLPGSHISITTKDAQESVQTMQEVSTRTSNQFLVEGGTRTSQQTALAVSSSTRSVTMEAFGGIVWASPAANSIRNSISSNIDLIITYPTVGLNPDTLRIYINDQDVTEDTTVDLSVTGQIRLHYEPVSSFAYAEKVWVKILVSSAPILYRKLAQAAAVGATYIKITDGDTSLMQPGSILTLGPNAAGLSEDTDLVSVVSSSELQVSSLGNAYQADDQVRYEHSSYNYSLVYWFETVNDYQAPTIIPLQPSEGSVMDRIPSIACEMYDTGIGIDLNSLVFTVNNIIVEPTVSQIDSITYRVSYTPEYRFNYGSEVLVYVAVSDKSSLENRAHTNWSFTIIEPELPILMDVAPGACEYPVHLDEDIKVDVYARSAGADLASLVFTIDQQKRTITTRPKIYRLE